MTVKTIIGECLAKMRQENFLDNQSYTAAQQELFSHLLSALNITYREITTEYLPLLIDETVVVSDGEYAPSGLTKTIVYPVGLVDKNGVKHAFKTYPDAIRTDFSGEATLAYAYLPEEFLDIEEEIGDLRLTQGLLSDGTLAEYYYENKVFDLADSYDRNYRNAVTKLRYKGREIKIRARGWRF